VDGLHTLGRWTRDAAGRTPDRIAIDDGTTRVTTPSWTAARNGWLGCCAATAGLAIATVTGNSADHVVLFFACAKARLVLCRCRAGCPPGRSPRSWPTRRALLLVEPAFADLAPGLIP